MSFSSVLTGLLREFGVSQTALAKKLGVSQSTVASWCTGKREHPRRDTIERIAKALGVEPSRLMESEDRSATPALPANPTKNDLVEAALQLYLNMSDDDRARFETIARALEKSQRGRRDAKAVKPKGDGSRAKSD